MGFAGPPAMPLTAAVWIQWDGVAPPGPADYVCPAQLAPIGVHDFVAAELPERELVTIIIRIPKGSLWTDSLFGETTSYPFPCSLLQCPIDTGLYYLAIYGHKVGEGFSNEFTRIYAHRLHGPGPEGLAAAAHDLMERSVGLVRLRGG